jgi:pseudouridine-5'-phosphate glycosidase
MVSPAIKLSPSVQRALEGAQPVVALETAVVTHGLPWPQGAQAALDMAQEVERQGAVPALVAVVEGTVRVGLEEEEVYRLAQAPQRKKCSIKDLPLAAALGWTAGTTVAATCWIAHQVGIGVFATGGIGGVHPGGERWDISADLPTLAQCPLVVVCAGAKSILDLPNTRELLETLGVAVVGYGADLFPAFYARSADLPVDARVDDPRHVARISRMRDALGLHQAILVVQPVPAQDAVPAEEVAQAVAVATSRAQQAGVTGNQLTPFVLSQLAHQEGEERFVRANLSLLRANARLAAQVAVAMARGD